MLSNMILMELAVMYGEHYECIIVIAQFDGKVDVTTLIFTMSLSFIAEFPTTTCYLLHLD